MLNFAHVIVYQTLVACYHGISGLFADMGGTAISCDSGVDRTW